MPGAPRTTIQLELTSMHAIRTLGTVAALATLATSCGYGRTGAGARPAEPALPLVVRNFGFYDVTIFALTSTAGGTGGKVRLDLVSGASTSVIRVPQRGRLPGGELVLLLHVVGRGDSWVSPIIDVPEGGTARLDISSDPSGNLGRSVLYAATSPRLPDE